MNADLPSPLADLRVDGGMARSDPFLQFQSDLLGLLLRRSPQPRIDRTGRGIPGRPGGGVWTDAATAVEHLQAGGQTFSPGKDAAWRTTASLRWQHAIETVRSYYRN